MTEEQKTALHHHWRLSVETLNPRFRFIVHGGVRIPATNESREDAAGRSGTFRSRQIHWIPSMQASLRALALAVLEGVGDARLGHWEEQGKIAIHIRRRCTPEEAAETGGVVDIRHTQKEERRRNIMQRFLPLSLRDYPAL